MYITIKYTVTWKKEFENKSINVTNIFLRMDPNRIPHRMLRFRPAGCKYVGFHKRIWEEFFGVRKDQQHTLYLMTWPCYLATLYQLLMFCDIESIRHIRMIINVELGKMNKEVFIHLEGNKQKVSKNLTLTNSYKLVCVLHDQPIVKCWF